MYKGVYRNQATRALLVIGDKLLDSARLQTLMLEQNFELEQVITRLNSFTT